jgi:glycosyltransferase involved in cell wall biosynthesis
LALTIRLAAARALGYRVVWTVHEPGRMDREREAISWWAARAVARQSDLVFAFDDDSAAAVRPWLRAGVEPIITGFPSYAEAHPPGNRTPPLRHELGIDDEAFVFLCLGHQRADKDLPLLLDAFARVPDPVALVVAGKADDARCNDLLTQAAARDHRVTYLSGHVPDDDLRWIIDSADTAVLARSREWTPSSLVLAQASGVPSIAADLPTSRVHLGPGAWLFTPGDAASLADAMTRAAADREAARRRGDAGRRFVDRHTWPDTVAVTASAINALGARVRDSTRSTTSTAPATATATATARS